MPRFRKLKFRGHYADHTHQENLRMDYMGGLSSVVSIVSFVIFAACAMKVFQMATTLTEIKDLLTALKLGSSLHPSAGTPLPLSSAPSGEEMLRAALREVDHPVNPTSIELGNKSDL